MSLRRKPMHGTAGYPGAASVDPVTTAAASDTRRASQTGMPRRTLAQVCCHHEAPTA